MSKMNLNADLGPVYPAAVALAASLTFMTFMTSMQAQADTVRPITCGVISRVVDVSELDQNTCNYLSGTPRTSDAIFLQQAKDLCASKGIDTSNGRIDISTSAGYSTRHVDMVITCPLPYFNTEIDYRYVNFYPAPSPLVAVLDLPQSSRLIAFLNSHPATGSDAAGDLDVACRYRDVDSPTVCAAARPSNSDPSQTLLFGSPDVAADAGLIEQLVLIAPPLPANTTDDSAFAITATCTGPICTLKQRR